jgi:hypothetical protein
MAHDNITEFPNSSSRHTHNKTGFGFLRRDDKWDIHGIPLNRRHNPGTLICKCRSRHPAPRSALRNNRCSCTGIQSTNSRPEQWMVESNMQHSVTCEEMNAHKLPISHSSGISPFNFIHRAPKVVANHSILEEQSLAP